MTPYDPMSTPTPTSIATLRDFPDRLSPILVKELRQGLRQHGFVLLFIFLQVIMAIVVFGSLAGSTPGSNDGFRAGQTVSGFFFVLFLIAGLGVQPLRGLNALAGEIRGDTIDLLLLTRLDAWRITFGKWLALFSQTCLLLIAILPYLIMRYYLGGMQLFNELLILFSLLVLSGTFTAITVGFSATPSIILRILLGLGIAFPMATSLFGAGAAMIDGRGPLGRMFLSGSTFLWAYTGGVAVAVFTGYYFLEMGATRIAPPSENRSTRKRLLGLAMLAITLYILPWDPVARIIIGFLLTLMLGFDALTENPEFTASVTRPFRRFRFPGKAAGMVLYPGWATGTIFILLPVAMLLYASLTTTSFGRDHDSIIGFGLLACTSLMFSAMFATLSRKGRQDTLPIFVVITLASYVLALILYILGNALDCEEAVAWFFPILPALGVVGVSELDREGGYPVLAAITFALWWLALFLYGRSWRRSAWKFHESPVTSLR